MKAKKTEDERWPWKEYIRVVPELLLVFLVIAGVNYFVNGRGYKGEDVFVVKEEGQYFFVDANNRTYNRDKYDYLDIMQGDFFRICEDGKWGYLNSGLGEAIEPQYEECGNFQNGMAPVYDGDEWFYVDYNNVKAIEQNYAWAGDFQGDKAVVKIDGEFFVIDKKGNNLAGPFYACDRLYENGFVVQETEKAEQIILTEKLEEIPLGVDSMETPTAIKDGMMAFSYIENGKRKARLRSLNGKRVLIDGVDSIAISYDGVVFYEKNDKWTMLDQNLNIINESTFENVIANSRGMYPVMIDGKWGAIDASGEIKIEPVYETMGPFEGGYASVKNADDKWGMIDQDGDMVIPCEYEFAQFALGEE